MTGRTWKRWPPVSGGLESRAGFAGFHDDGDRGVEISLPGSRAERRREAVELVASPRHDSFAGLLEIVLTDQLGSVGAAF